MISKRELFFRHLAQTSPAPLALEIEKAEGVFLYTPEGKKIIDLISGVSVNNVGHRHPAVVRAVTSQMERYMHLMVYGEIIQSPQVLLARKLTGHLPAHLNKVYLVNSGSEANEGALKLAKKATGRSGIICFENAYHGSTHGCLSVIGGDAYQQGYGLMLEDVKRQKFNDMESVTSITRNTACVILEVIQGEGGIIAGRPGFLKAIRERCSETGALLIIDEVQTGFGRTGKMFAFEQYGIVPDILTLAKGMGGGMPIGAFIASDETMAVIQDNPPLGHITTFGGHPVSAAAALASLEIIEEPGFLEAIPAKGERFVRGLSGHPAIRAIRQHGLMLACELVSGIRVQDFIIRGLENGILSDWFLFCDHAFRIAPPLTIDQQEIDEAIQLIIKTLDGLSLSNDK
ncbi:MAG TPA: aminotransferase class III-fold pyridoxal phosphate-dependent enzyme [Bacteroidales bacterium]|nr:aminotransferase class III-fold pyridoxal phosphate-dependent enzyme [Bacteroidales bacterium]HRZ50186.1 aminotransferase class III-fold pyridoxal phosphate-dependent enzyme [Bacteroidales bacterium]